MGFGPDPDLHGTLEISSYEARVGTNKLVNIPWGFHKQLIRINVPPGTQEGSRLRLKGLGKNKADGGRGDLYLKVMLREEL